MNVTIRLLGLELLAIDVSTDVAGTDDVADVLTTGTTFGFVGDCRYDVVPGGEV